MHAAFYVVPEGVSLPAPFHAEPGDTVILRPAHPTRPLTIIREIPHGQLPRILEYLDRLELVQVTGATPAVSEVHGQQVLFAVAGDPPPRPARPGRRRAGRSTLRVLR
jgi:hypothetical protein